MKSFLPVLLSLSLLAIVAGCSRPPESRSDARPIPDNGLARHPTHPAVTTLAENQSAGFCEQANALQQSINAFLDSPTTATLRAAREQWRETHARYAKLQVGYLLAGLAMPQIHDDRDPIDAHPMLPGYLDQVPGYPRSGLVYSEVPMTPEFLRSEHQSTDFYYLTLGLHPLEFMLWDSKGQSDRQRVALFTPPARPADDQVDARRRRVDLLRLIARALPRDSADLCAPGQVQVLAAALNEMAGNPEALQRALLATLEHLVRQPLSAWKAHPEGEDGNGMPLWHSPRARTDFAEMNIQLTGLAQQWLPVLAPSSEPDLTKPLATALDRFAGQLPSPGNSKAQPAPENIADLLEQLKSLQAPLSRNDRDQTTSAPANSAAQ